MEVSVSFTENMWRLGDEASYDFVMDTIIPRLREREDVWSRFLSDITGEFRSELAERSFKERYIAKEKTHDYKKCCDT